MTVQLQTELEKIIKTGLHSG